MRLSKPVIYILVFLISANVLARLAVYHFFQSRFLEVSFFDVGQGDSIFIETPGQVQVLIDGGPSSLILERLSEEMPFWDRTIDLVILTHPERDHMAGLLEALQSYQVENIVWTGLNRDNAEFEEWLRLIKKEQANVRFVSSGQRISIGDYWLDVLYPFETLEGKTAESSNEYALVTRLSCGKKSFLFTSDIPKSVEKKLLGKGVLDSDLLKVAHHGSKYSSGEAFISEVSPEMAVIQSGKGNSYGHPHQEVLDILEKYGISIFRTDINGNIKILCDSQSLRPVLQE
jgi:competence protein ComEC